MNYDTATDFDINKAVAEALGILHEANTLEEIVWAKVPSDFEEGQEQIVIFSPCENPSDAWPIIVESGIDVLQNSNDATAFRPSGVNGAPVDYTHKNGLRAAMIVFLKLKEGEQ